MLSKNNSFVKPKVVRIGKSTEKSVNYLVNKATLEVLAQEKIKKQSESEEISNIKRRIKDKEDLLTKLKLKAKDGKTEPIIEDTIKDIQKYQKILENKLSSSGKNSDLIKIENQILEEYNIYASTLSTSAIERISKIKTKFK